MICLELVLFLRTCAATLFSNGEFNPIYAMPVADGGTARASVITLTGTPTSAGQAVVVNLGGDRYEADVVSGSNFDDIAGPLWLPQSTTTRTLFSAQTMWLVVLTLTAKEHRRSSELCGPSAWSRLAQAAWLLVTPLTRTELVLLTTPALELLLADKAFIPCMLWMTLRLPVLDVKAHLDNAWDEQRKQVRCSAWLHERNFGGAVRSTYFSGVRYEAVLGYEAGGKSAAHQVCGCGCSKRIRESIGENPVKSLVTGKSLVGIDVPAPSNQFSFGNQQTLLQARVSPLQYGAGSVQLATLISTLSAQGRQTVRYGNLYGSASEYRGYEAAIGAVCDWWLCASLDDER